MITSNVYQRRKQKDEDISIAMRKDAEVLSHTWVPQTPLKRKSEEKPQHVYRKRPRAENVSRVTFLDRVAKQEAYIATRTAKIPTQVGLIDRVLKKQDNGLCSNGACKDSGFLGIGIYKETDFWKRESDYSCRESTNGIFDWEDNVKVPENVKGCGFSPSCLDLNKSPIHEAFVSGLVAADQQRGSVCSDSDSYRYPGERVFSWKENEEVIGDTRKGFIDLNESEASCPFNELLPLTSFSSSTSQVSVSDDKSQLLFCALSSGQVQGEVERRNLDMNSEHPTVAGRMIIENNWDRHLVAKDTLAATDLENHSNSPNCCSSKYDPEKDVQDDMVSLTQDEKLEKVERLQTCAEIICFPSTPIPKDKTLRNISNIKQYMPRIATETVTPKLVSPRKTAKKSRRKIHVKAVKQRGRTNRSRNKDHMVPFSQSGIGVNLISTHGNFVAVQKPFKHDSGIKDKGLNLGELENIFDWKTCRKRSMRHCVKIPHMKKNILDWKTRGKRSMRHYFKSPLKKNHVGDQTSYWSSCRRFGPIIICLNRCRKLTLNFPKNCSRKRSLRRRELHVPRSTSVVLSQSALITKNSEGNELPNSFQENDNCCEVLEGTTILETQQLEFNGSEVLVGPQQAAIGVKMDNKNEGEKEQNTMSDSCSKVGPCLGLALMNEEHGAIEAKTTVEGLNEEYMQLDPHAVNSNLQGCDLQIIPFSCDLLVVESFSRMEDFVGAKSTKKKIQRQKSHYVSKTRGSKKLLEGGKAMLLRKANRKRFPATLDNIIRRLKSLNLDALFPHQGSGERKIIPKIHKETEWSWSNEKKDGEQEIYWKAEREVYQRRARLFISILELIQGPRGFIPWKGSVVDSVVGVWLTQNASDLHSSRAVMALRSIFGFQSRSSSGTCDQVTEFVKLIESTSDFPCDLQVNHYYVSEPEEDASTDDVASLLEPKDHRVVGFESAIIEDDVPRGTTSEILKNESSVGCSNGEMSSESEVIHNESIEPAFISNRLRTSSSVTRGFDSRGQKNKVKDKKEEKMNWDDLRKKYSRERDSDHMDSVDWEAVRCANFVNIATAIKGRGQHFIIAKKIQNFLNRVIELHGSIDLEWLRYAPPDDVREYLMAFDGLGPKSVDCIRLLALEQCAFPVDTNVGRLAIRLGWIPLKPLPTDVPFHQLKKYPSLDKIQEYLWPRLCKLDHRTLYKLHYHMITFGKVFCRQIKPNCNSCPLRPYCKYYASLIASQNKCLPESTENIGCGRNVAAVNQISMQLTGSHLVMNNHKFLAEKSKSIEQEQNIGDMGHFSNAVTLDQITLLLMAPNSFLEFNSTENNQAFLVEEPQSLGHAPPKDLPNSFVEFDSTENNQAFLVEEPQSPEDVPPKDLSDIEDMFSRDISSNDEEIPGIISNDKELHANLRKLLDDYRSTFVDCNLSQALVPLSAKATSMPAPQLKNISRRRTVLQVYELPDNHELLAGLKPREKSDKVPYLLAMWTPGGPADTCEFPKTKCNNQGTGLCNDRNCTSCESMPVRGTILIPCRTALEGKFPLNGTYFQVNEVFADHYSSYHPFIVQRKLIQHLRKRTVCFGTTVSEIFKDLQTEVTRHIFGRGFICIRGFNRSTGILEHLAARFHCPPRWMKNGRKKDMSDGETKAPNTELTLHVTTPAPMVMNQTNLHMTGNVGVDSPIASMQPR